VLAALEKPTGNVSVTAKRKTNLVRVKSDTDAKTLIGKKFAGTPSEERLVFKVFAPSQTRLARRSRR